ncbi:hypothetical protein [Erwinia persicina]|uniref:Gliding motility protein n=2 Tax=Erwinia persicina TaxID=55211 RepID=A0ABR8ZPC0_9GAMM|nr:hypothetical protein [Erwinia persicina]MBD8105511.1 hypothetical protein [Erwinia persicina]MBD8211572.1 hypothetical protein [Erwinia persicina]
MKPTPGDIYCVYHPLLQQYVACQITALKDKNMVAVLDLDWCGASLPDAAALAAMRPLVCDYYFWRGRYDHSFLPASIPPHYTLVGNVPPLVHEEVNSYAGGWNVGNSLYNQRHWNAIDADKRARFKAASRDRQVTLPAGVLPENTTKITDTHLAGLTDYALLDQLPCLTTVETAQGSEGLAAYLRQHPFIMELHWASSAGMTALDLSGSPLKRLIIDPTGLTSLRVNDGLNLLSLSATPAPDLTIHSRHQGRDLTLMHGQTLPSLQGLDALRGLHLTQVAQADIAAIADRFPALAQLRLWGKPGVLTHMDSLARLSALQMFTTVDLFGFASEDVPSPEALPHMAMLWMTSLPADVATSVKKRWKKVDGVDLSITKPRKPEWLAENLNNPFRDWDGRENISPAHAKKAAALYKQACISLREINGSSDAASVNATAETLVRSWAEAFNAMDRRSSSIETIEREEIADVIYGLLCQMEQQLGQDASERFDSHAMMDLFDRLRDF